MGNRLFEEKEEAFHEFLSEDNPGKKETDFENNSDDELDKISKMMTLICERLNIDIA